MSERLALNAVNKAIPKRNQAVIGKRFAWCVSKEILIVARRLCATRRGRAQICAACRRKSLAALERLMLPLVRKRFECIPCKDVRYYVDWSFKRLIKVLFPTICRMCKCR